MITRKLGKGLEVSALGLGCMRMSWSYGQPKGKQEKIAFLRAAYARRGRHAALARQATA